MDLATIAAPPARDETPARPEPAKESAAVLERASISWLLLWAAGNLGSKTRFLFQVEFACCHLSVID